MPFDFEKPQPLQDAIDSVSKRTPIGTALNSAQIAQLPAGLREENEFSAKVESARAMQNVKDGLLKMLSHARDEQAKVAAGEGQRNEGKPGAYQMDRGKFIAENQQLANRLGLRTKEQEKVGTVQDFGSERRLKLIYEQRIGAAQAKAFHLQGQDPDVLNAWPALELVRVSARAKKRDWKTRWSDAAAAVNYVGVSRTAMADLRLIALKTSPIWVALSRFGRPYPPFDFNSGMGVQEIDREEAEGYGLVQPGEELVPNAQATEDEIAASVRGLDPDLQQALKKEFGDEVEITGDEVKWKGSGNAPAAPVPVPVPLPSVPTPVPTPTPTPAPTAPAPAKKPKPAGVPVSASANVQVVKRDEAAIREVLKVVDRVHGDGTLAPIPFNRRVSKRSDGTYWSNPARAVSIGVKKAGATPAISLVHEMGHWLDHIGIASSGKFASESFEPLMNAWRDAVRASPTYQKILAMPASNYRDYLLKMREVWARAYSQFIAVESGNATLLAELNKVRDGKTGFKPENHWPDAEFEPIAVEIRKLFASLGWTK